jgi:type III pantothenate kinase
MRSQVQRADAEGVVRLLCYAPFIVSRPNYLLIDISNSFTKLAFSTSTRLSRPQRIATADLGAAFLRRFLKKQRVDQLVVSSVVPAKNRAIRQAAQSRPVLWLNCKLNLGVGVEYPAPKTIGADRLANAAAVAVLYGCPAIVVDFGTAVTFDIVSEKNRYIGGVIAPGLESMTNFLYQRTALLPKLSLKEPRRAVGKSTEGAMMAGAIFGYRGLVREIIRRIKAERFPRHRVHVVATGGYARLITRQLPEIEAVHANLTLEGLRIAAGLNT